MSEINKNILPTKLLWVDLEMSGLDVTKQRILEVALIVTDFNLVELDRYEAVIHHENKVIENAEPWVKQNSQKLLDEVLTSDKTENQVISDITNLISKHFNQEPAILAGNSVHTDKLFIKQWWPGIDSLLHYRILDVSSFKIWVQGTEQIAMEKGEKHRALEDIQESIKELRWCLTKLTDSK